MRSETTLTWLQHDEESDNDDLYYDPVDTDSGDNSSSAFIWTSAKVEDSPEHTVMRLPETVEERLFDRDPLNSLDLVARIDGMFRILDLVSEQGSGGLGIHFSAIRSQFCLTLNITCSGQDHNRSSRIKSIHERIISRCLYLSNEGRLQRFRPYFR